jgi:hypothetical protein
MSEPFVHLPRLGDYVDHWAMKLPDCKAMIQHED